MVFLLVALSLATPLAEGAETIAVIPRDGASIDAALRVAESHGARLLAEVSLWLAVCHLTRKEEIEANDRFQSAFLLDPGLIVDPAVFPPAVVSAAGRVRAAIPSLARGNISVVVEPARARIFLNGRTVGRAPITLDLAQGSNVVTGELLGYRPFAARVRATANRLESHRVYLRPLEGEALGAAIERAVAQGSPDLEHPQAIAALGGLLGASLVAVVAQGDATAQLTVVDSATGKVRARLTGADDADVASQALASLRPKTAPVRETDPRFWLRLSAGATKYFGAFGGAVVDVVSAGIAYAIFSEGSPLRFGGRRARSKLGH